MKMLKYLLPLLLLSVTASQAFSFQGLFSSEEAADEEFADDIEDKEEEAEEEDMEDESLEDEGKINEHDEGLMIQYLIETLLLKYRDSVVLMLLFFRWIG